MDLSSFCVSLFNVCTFLFDKTSNVIVFVPTLVLYVCACWMLLRAFLHGSFNLFSR